MTRSGLICELCSQAASYPATSQESRLMPITQRCGPVPDSSGQITRSERSRGNKVGWQDAPEDTAAPVQGSQPAWMSAPLEATSVGQSQQPPDPTWRDRLNAFEGGVLRGGAYLAGMVPDAVANVGSLGVSSY